MKKIIRILICAPILVVLFFSWMIVQMGLSFTSDKTPIVFDPEGICGGKNGVYAVDTGSQKICAYDWNGDFLYAVKYTDSGSCVIFSDEDGNLCRYSVRKDTVYVYGQNGKVADTYSVDLSQEKEILALSKNKKQVSYLDKSAELDSRLFGDEIIITSGEEQINVRSGNALWNIGKPLFIIAIICVAAVVIVSAVQLAISYIDKKKT